MSQARSHVDLAGRVALVTGASGWLGAPISSALAAAGARVWLAGRRREPLDRLADELLERGAQARALLMDVTDPEQRRMAIETISTEHGRLDVLVNNAHGGRPQDIAPDDDHALARATGLGITAPWRLTTGLLALLESAVRLAGDAAVVNISSMYGKVSPDPRVYERSGQPANPLPYGAAKAGIL